MNNVKHTKTYKNKLLRCMYCFYGVFFTDFKTAPVAQLDRVLGYEPRGREFESLRARH